MRARSAAADLELRFAITVSGALCDARRADEAVALLEPHAAVGARHADVEQQWEYWAATALALDYADRLADAMPAWDAALAVAQQADRRDMVWKTMSNTASTQAKMGLVAQAAQAAEQAHRLARASNEAVTLRVLQMQVTLAHRLRDVGRYAQALALLEEALAGTARRRLALRPCARRAAPRRPLPAARPAGAGAAPAGPRAPRACRAAWP